MSIFPLRFARPGVLLALVGCVALLVAFTGSAAAATTTLTFKEPEKGSTFAFVDNAPKAQRKHGFPTKFSPGDEFVFTNPMEMEGKQVGRLRVVCIATSTARKPEAAGFICHGIAKLSNGTLVFVAMLSEGKTEGAIVGGSGAYAGARGSFVSHEGKGSSTTVVTLIE
jgi:hypothetical protein